MKKDKTRQLLTIFSLFMLLVLPTAIVGYNNFSSLVNQAFAKPFQKEESTYIVQTESSANITKGSQFSLKVTAAAPKAIPLNHFAAFIEFDKTKVDVKTIQLQNSKLLKVMSYQNGFLVYPATMAAPENFASLKPTTCSAESTCDFSQFSLTSVVFSVNGVLVSDLTEQQRPIKITMLGAAETSTIAIWNEKILLPVLKLGEYLKNSAPEFVSEPVKYVHEGEAFVYNVETTEIDKDPTTLSLVCPDSAFCDKVQKAPEGLSVEENVLTWKNPVYQLNPYEITLYVNDGKSVSTQTFSLQVLQKDTSYFSCTFTPAVSVRILDYRVETPLTIVAESSTELASATVTLIKEGTIEKTFDYTFNPASKQVILDKASNPSLSYKFNEGQYTGKATFTSTTGVHFTCELANPTVSLRSIIKETFAKTVTGILKTVQALGITVGTNNSPVFTSDPMVAPANGGSSPSVSFVYGNAYSFILKAQDQDGDPLQHAIVAKPSWATVAVSSSNSPTGPSSYSIQFTGTPQAKDAGSNLFSVSVNDGYGHYITRTWVINIDYPNNDIPRVTIIEPLKSTTRYQGSGFLLKWDVTDRHQVVSFGVKYTKSLSASAKRITYNNNISHNTRGIIVNTASIPPGDYYFIVTATDGFSPPATGSGYTAMVRILPPKPKPTATPKPTAKPTASVTPTVTATTKPTPTPTATEEPTPEVDELSIQITTPKSQAQLTPQDFQSVITFGASKQGELTKDSIVIKLDGEDITEKFKLSTEKGKTITASYKPSVLLEPGIHELTASAKDSKQKEKEVKVSFTVLEDTEASSNTVNFLGIYIDKKWYTLFIAGLILIVILILMPIILYFAFRNSEKDSTKPPTPRKPVVPLDAAGNPTLRTPNASFAQQNNIPPAMNSTFKPVLVPKPSQPTPIPDDIPRVTPKEALENFVAQTPMQEAKPVVHTPAPLDGPVFTSNTAPRSPQQDVKKPEVAVHTPAVPAQAKPLVEAPKPVPPIEQKKPAVAIVQPESKQQMPMMRMQQNSNPVNTSADKRPVPNQQYPMPQSVKIAAPPATIPGKQQNDTGVSLPKQSESQPTVSNEVQKPVEPQAPTINTSAPKVEEKTAIPVQSSASLPPESPSIPGLG